MAKAETGRRNLPFINLIISNVYEKAKCQTDFLEKSKSSILHFASCFPEDNDLNTLALWANQK